MCLVYFISIELIFEIDQTIVFVFFQIYLSIHRTKCTDESADRFIRPNDNICTEIY